MGELQIDINGEIGNSMFGETGGVTAKSIAERISKNRKAEEIILNIDSPGGSVYEGYAISNLIFEQRSKGKTVTAVIKGMCASIATLIALSADKVIMLPFSSWMIHNPFVGLQGDAEELRRAASELEKIQNKLIEVYANKSGKDPSEIQALMKEERTLSAREAKEYGFADEVLEEIRAVAYWKKKSEDKMDSKATDLFNKFFDKIEKLLKNEAPPAPKNIETTLEDGTAVTIEPDLSEGAIVTIGGAPAPEGEHTLSDGTLITVDASGVITSITAPSQDNAELENLKKENEALKAKLAEAEAKAIEQAKAIEDQTKSIQEIKTEVQNLKKLTVGGKQEVKKPEQKFKEKQVEARKSVWDHMAEQIKNN